MQHASLSLAFINPVYEEGHMTTVSIGAEGDECLKTKRKHATASRGRCNTKKRQGKTKIFFFYRDPGPVPFRAAVFPGAVRLQISVVVAVLLLLGEVLLYG